MRAPVLFLLFATLTLPAGAQTPGEPLIPPSDTPADAPAPPSTPAPVAEAPTAAGVDQLITPRAELDAIAHDMELTDQRQEELRREIGSLDKDRATLNQALIEGNREVQRLEGQIGDTEARIAAIGADEDKVRASLAGRRDVLAEVLAALQRLGYHPPPALLVRPEDALSSIRSSILLSALVPDLRQAADALAADLGKLVTLRQSKEAERDQLKKDAQALAEGRERIALLIEARQKQLSASTDALTAEEKRADELADQATSLRDLIARIEQENATAAAAAAAAEKAAAEARAAATDKPAGTLGPADRLAPKVAFANAKGLLPLPVNGRQLTGYGDNDKLGGRSPGITLATLPGATVSAPADGWVVFAGPFRSYGQLLILNAGDGYHVLLAGMEKIDVQLGQLVLAGEPVGMMASQKVADLGDGLAGESQATLYVEFRKDGVSIDPTPWWAPKEAEKVGG